MAAGIHRSHVFTRRQLIGSAAGAGATVLAHRSLAGAQAAPPSPQASPAILFRDEFREGFLIDGAGARWGHFALPAPDGSLAFVGDDGIASTSDRGLEVKSGGSHAQTGEPTFTKTVPPEVGDPAALPGGIDHVKWLVYTTDVTTGGLPGFDAEPGSELVFHTRMSGRCHGTAGHPFGDHVHDPADDLRLASPTFNTYDPESWMVFDFWLTNRQIYAFYERLPFGRAQLGNYAAFSFQLPVGQRSPDDWHDLAIAYDRSAGTVRWIVDGEERFRVDRIGHLIDRQDLTIDHGGTPESIEPRQLSGGMGLLTLLDGALPSGDALVRLSDVEGTYFDPQQGEPAAQVFVDEASSDASRLFGQGAALQMEHFTVERRAAPGSRQ
jgi:hypothetical protein